MHSDADNDGVPERPYVALSSDGDMIETYDREEAFEWADEHLDMVESLQPEGKDHWVQITSYRPSFSHDEADNNRNEDHD